MAPQKKYGNRRKQEPLFRLSPFVRSSSVQQKPDNIDELADQVEKIHIKTPLQRKVLGPKDGNGRSLQKSCNLKQKNESVEQIENLSRLVSKIDIQKPVAVVQVTELGHEPSVKRPSGLKDGYAQSDRVGDLSRLVAKLDIHNATAVSRSSEASTEFTSPLLELCSGSPGTPTSFSVWSSTLEPHFNIVKIAEASYGEVYRLVLKADHPEFTKSDESVLKILALKAPATTKPSKAQVERERTMSAMDNVVAEVKVLQRMADIPGFTHFRDIRVLQGKPSSAFAKAWKKFNDSRPEDDKSQFPDPSKRSSYTNQQLWAIIEMQDAGTDLEHVQLRNVFPVWDVFWGVTLTLAKGEQEAEFEHRDLHMGNICVKPRKEDEAVGVENARIRNLDQRMGFTGLETTIIDYTLSRAVTRYDKDLTAEIEYLDLAKDPELFESEGDYQYDMYRHMRDVVDGNDWADFNPMTNLVWLHFILHEMLSSPYFSWGGTASKPRQRKRHSGVHIVPSTAKRVTSPRPKRTPTDTTDHEAKLKKEKQLTKALKHVSKLLELDQLAAFEDPSAAGLVRLAIQNGWLDETDVVGEGDTSLASLISQ